MTAYKSDIQQSGSAHLVLIAAVVVVLVAGAGALVAAKSLGKHKTVTSKEEVSSLLADTKAGKYDAKCTFSTASTGSAALSINSGTLYISANKKRVDGALTSKASNTSKTAHVVQNDSSVYIWTGGSKEGSKLPISSSSSSQSLSDKLTKSPDNYKLSCQNVGHLSDATFAIPSDVNFVDVNQQLKTQSYSSDGSQ